MTYNGRDFVGVILAAGLGKRLWPLTQNIPKPLLPVCNKPIIQYQIDYLYEIGVRKIFVAVGNHIDKFKSIVDQNASSGLSIDLVKQDKPLGIAHALYSLSDLIEGPFFLSLGDTLIFPNPFQAMLSAFQKNDVQGVLSATIEDNPEKMRRNFAIIADGDGHVSRVIEKPRRSATSLKGCGAYLFQDVFFDSLRRTPRTVMRDEYEITDSIQLFIDDGYRVDVWSGIDWEINLTQPRDYLESNLEMLDRLGKKYLVGAQVSIPDDTKIIRSVIGARSEITGTKSIANSVIFDDTLINVEGGTVINNWVIAKDQIVRVVR